MGIIDHIRPLWNILRLKFITLNTFDTKSTNEDIIRREILSTRLFLILFLISVFIISLYSSIIIHVQTETLKLPTQIQYEKLLEKYSDSLQCPCTQISIYYNEFTQIKSSFHEVCSSYFVSEEWINLIYPNNLSLIWPMDIRTSLSSMWKLISDFCKYSNDTINDVFNEFYNTKLISSMIFSENLLKIQIETMIKLIYKKASETFIRSYISAHQITQSSGFLTGLSTNYITLLPINGWESFRYLYTGQSRYIQTNSSEEICYCQSDRSCPMPGNLYLYNSWETYGLYNLTLIIPNETLPGIIVDCLPIQMMLQSSFECFYNLSCIQIILSTYSTNINISTLNKSLSSRFNPETKIEFIINELFIEDINFNINYKLYFYQCNPNYCIYSISRRFDIIFIITNIIGLIGGLNVALRLISPYLIYFILHFKNRRARIDQHIQIERLTIKIRLRNLINDIKLHFIELNIFNSHSQDIIRTNNERISTRFYIVLLISAISVLIFYTYLSLQTISRTIEYPSVHEYEILEEKFRNALICPCTNIKILHGNFLEINPIYHQLCQSGFVKPSWYQKLNTLTGRYSPGDFRPTASSHFQMLSILCEIANLTLIHANRRFYSTELITKEILSRNLFISQTESLINSFINSTKFEFSYTLSMINTVIHSNQYISGTQTNAYLFTTDLSLFGIYSNKSLQIYPLSRTIYQENDINCICAQNSSCTGPFNNNFLWTVYGVRLGCYIMDSVLQSSLICWYNQTCFNDFREAFFAAGVYFSNDISLLDVTLNNKFSPDTTLQTIVQEIMVNHWNTSISYDNFYKECHPIYCKYTYQIKNSPLLIVTTIIGLFGGLNIILRLICPIIAQIFAECEKRRTLNTRPSTDNNHQQIYIENETNIRQNNLRTNIYQKLVQLNLFDSNSNDVNIIRNERLSTRLYLILLFIIIFIQITFNIILKQTEYKIVLYPSQNEYENLNKLYSNRVQCPCNNISIKYKEFIIINTNFHQICSSDFVDDVWINFLFGPGFWPFQIKSDIRGRGAAYFRLLSALCDLSKTTINNSINQFIEEVFVINNIISSEEFLSKIYIIIEQFKINTPYRFSRSLKLVRDITNDNTFISTYLLNWEWIITNNLSNSTIYTNPVSPDNLCSCAKQSYCKNPGGIYRETDNEQLFAILGFYVGCSTIETLFQSTFQCLYNQTCIDQLQYYATYLSTYPSATRYINAMNFINSSRFLLDTTIENIVNELFIEEWNINITYSNFYKQCYPIYCSYTIEEYQNLIYIFTKLLAIYGGLTVALRLITPYIIRSIFFIMKCTRTNTVTPYTE